MVLAVRLRPDSAPETHPASSMLGHVARHHHRHQAATHWALTCQATSAPLRGRALSDKAFLGWWFVPTAATVVQTATPFPRSKQRRLVGFLAPMSTTFLGRSVSMPPLRSKTTSTVLARATSTPCGSILRRTQAAVAGGAATHLATATSCRR